MSNGGGDESGSVTATSSSAAGGAAAGPRGWCRFVHLASVRFCPGSVHWRFSQVPLDGRCQPRNDVLLRQLGDGLQLQDITA